MRYLTLLVLFVAGCAAGELLPESERTLTYVIKTKANKDEAYNRALAHTSSILGDANEAIKVKNQAAGQIVMQANVTCNELRQSGDINNYSLRFVLDIKVKDKKARLTFEDLEMVGENGLPTSWSYNQLVSKENVKKVEPCAIALRDSIAEKINKSDDF